MSYGLSQIASQVLRLVPRRADVEDVPPEGLSREIGSRYRFDPAAAGDGQIPSGGLTPRADLRSAVDDRPRLIPRSELAAAPAPPGPPRLGPRGMPPLTESIAAQPGAPTSRYSSRPPLTPSIDASGAPQTDALPSGMALGPRQVDPGRAPTPPLSAYSRSYGQYEAERDSLPSEREYIEAHRPHGLLPRIGSAAKLGAKFLVQSGLNPVVAAEGLAIGAIDRDANARYNFRTDIERRSVDRQQRYLSNAGRDLGMQNTVDDNRRADEALRQSSEAHAATLQDRENQWTERLQERLLNDWMARNPGLPIPKSVAVRSGHPELEGHVPPKKVGAGPQPHFQYNQVTGETAVVEPDGGGGWKISRPQGERMEPTPEAPVRDPFSTYEATVTPQAYGVKNWNDLVDNPAYGPAYQQALDSARQIVEPGETPEHALNMLIGGGRVHLPPRQIPAYEYARQNPHPGQAAAAAARNADKRNTRLTPRSSLPPRSAPAGNKTLTADQVQKFVDATPPNAQGRKPTIEEAKTFLRSKGYVVP